MADLGPVLQFLAAIVVGIGSGVGAAIVTNRHATRRYRSERMDCLIPAARRIAELYAWQGESWMGIRQSGPPEEEFRAAKEEFNRYRHDLPAAVQKALNQMDNEDGVLFDYADAMVAASTRLREWVDGETQRQGRQRGFLRNSVTPTRTPFS